MNINITIKQPYINNHTQKTLSHCFFKLHQVYKKIGINDSTDKKPQ